jgi:hypothetical protein
MGEDYPLFGLPGGCLDSLINDDSDSFAELDQKTAEGLHLLVACSNASIV